MRTRLPSGDKGRINSEVQMETYRNVLIYAAETHQTVSAAVDRLLRRGLLEYTRQQQAEDSRG